MDCTYIYYTVCSVPRITRGKVFEELMLCSAVFKQDNDEGLVIELEKVRAKRN